MLAVFISAVLAQPFDSVQLPLTQPDRYLMTATGLPDGRVLFTGGNRNGSGSPAAETWLFDPLTGQLDAGPPLAVARAVHNAVRLPSGDVLVTGDSATAELYVFSTRTWLDAGELSDSRLDGQLLRFSDGTVRLIGGRSGDRKSTVERYDPVGRTWSLDPPLPSGLDTSSALVFEDGGAMLFGGGDGGSETGAWLRWNGTAFFKAGDLLEERSDLVVARTAADTVTVITGFRADAGPLPSTEELDLRTGVFTRGAGLPIGGYDWATEMLPSGRVMLHYQDNAIVRRIDGGWSGPGSVCEGTLGNAFVLPTGRTGITGIIRSGICLIDERSDGYRAAARMPLKTASYSVTTLPDGRVLLLGGDGDAGTTAWSYDPVADAWRDAGALREHRADHSAALLFDGRVFVAGGVGADGGTLDTTELFDPGTGTSVAGPTLQRPRALQSAVVRGDGRVLLLGGRRGATTVVADVELYDPLTQTTAAQPALASARWGGGVQRLPDGTVLLAGGSGPSNSYVDTAELVELDGGTLAFPALSGVGRDVFGFRLLPGSREVLLAGGYGMTGPLREVWKYDVARRTWTRRPDLPVTSAAPGVLLRSGFVLMPLGGYSTAFVTYDPLTERWAANLLAPFQPYLRVARLRDGEVLLFGGDDGTLLDQAERYREEPATTLPRPVAVPDLPSVLPGHSLGFTGSGLLAPSRIGGSTTEPVSWDEVVFAVESLEGWEYRLLESHATSATQAYAVVPDDLLEGWWWARPIVHGVSGLAQPVFVGAPQAVLPDGGTMQTDGGTTPTDGGPMQTDGGTTVAPRNLAVCGCASTPGTVLLALLALRRSKRRK